MGAGIHANVFQAEEGVSPGAVLMLEQVVVLAAAAACLILFGPDGLELDG